MQRQDIVKNLSEIIHREAPEAKVILYGSQARGDAGPKSDIDLLILLDKDKVTLEDEEKITYPIYLLELKTGILISPMVVAKKIWENRPFKTPFYINVMNEGVEI
ncbi:MAG: nucleotidyltransferase domain-containing protein [Paludibacter sp.]